MKINYMKWTIRMTHRTKPLMGEACKKQPRKLWVSVKDKSGGSSGDTDKTLKQC